MNQEQQTKNHPTKLSPEQHDNLTAMLDEIIAYGATAATLIVTFPGGRQWKLSGQSPEIDASFQAPSK